MVHLGVTISLIKINSDTFRVRKICNCIVQNDRQVKWIWHGDNMLPVSISWFEWSADNWICKVRKNYLCILSSCYLAFFFRFLCTRLISSCAFPLYSGIHNAISMDSAALNGYEMFRFAMHKKKRCLKRWGISHEYCKSTWNINTVKCGQIVAKRRHNQMRMNASFWRTKT